VFGASTVYLALKRVDRLRSIPIAVLAISLLKKLGGSTILENNIVQTSLGGREHRRGVVFTLPGFLFLAVIFDGQERRSDYFSYWTIFTLALLGECWVLMMVPLRRALIVKEHGNLPYPENRLRQVLIAGERVARWPHRVHGPGVRDRLRGAAADLEGDRGGAGLLVTRASSRIFPGRHVNASITPEYLGSGTSSARRDVRRERVVREACCLAGIIRSSRRWSPL